MRYDYMDEKISVLKSANSILKFYKDSPIWNDVIRFINEKDVDYCTWNDIDILIYYLSNKPEED